MVGALSLTWPTAMQISLERKKAFTGTPTAAAVLAHQFGREVI